MTLEDISIVKKEIRFIFKITNVDGYTKHHDFLKDILDNYYLHTNLYTNVHEIMKEYRANDSFSITLKVGSYLTSVYKCSDRNKKWQKV